jgi:phospholipid transport system substrate-binding protein
MVTRRELLGSIGAAAALAWPSGAGAQADDAAARIQAFYDSLQAALAESDPARRMAAVSEAMTRTFDIAAITRLAIGPHWSKIPAPKQASLQDAFGRYFIATYASQLGKAAGGRFEVLPKAEQKNEQRAGGRLVRTRVIDGEGKATPVDYLVNAEGRVVDIYLGGTVSMLAARRSEFDGALKAGGPDALEAHLRKRTEAVGGT